MSISRRDRITSDIRDLLAQYAESGVFNQDTHRWELSA